MRASFLMAILIIGVANFTMAQADNFFVPTAEGKRWELVKTEVDKKGAGEKLLLELKKEFGLPTSLRIESDGNFMWNVTDINGSTTSTGAITEENDFCFFKFIGGKIIKAFPYFREYDTEMYLTMYGKTKEEFMTLVFKLEKNN